LTFSQLAVVGLFAALFARAAHQPAQNDTWWQLRAGQDIWHGLYPTTERWTFTAHGRYWPDHEWLSQAIFYALHTAGGMPLLTLFTAAVVTAAFAVGWVLMGGSTWRRLLLFVATVPATLITSAVRPQVLSVLLLLVVVWLIQEQRFKPVPLVFLLWANLHGQVVLGGVVLVAALVTAALSERRATRPLVIATALSGLATFVTPLGPKIVTLLWANTGQLDIEEWRPAWENGVAGLLLAIVAIAFFVATWQLWRHNQLEWSNRSVVAAGVALLPLAIRYGRILPTFMFVALVVIARAWEVVRPSSPRADEPAMINTALAAAFVMGAILWTLFSWQQDDPALAWHPLPSQAVAAARQCDGPLYNRFDDGGYLAYFAQDIPYFVDGRVDPFPKSFLTDQFRSEGSGDYEATFAKWGITCALLPPESPTAQHLRADHWRTTYADGDWLVLQRP
jgi:MFS family permease